jgi:heme-degrading monooxygenase HmoA
LQASSANLNIVFVYAGCGLSASDTTGQDGLVIVEHAILPVIPGQEDAFERAFAAARAIISGMQGFRSLSLSRGIESPSSYLLLVEWDRLEDHTKGFRGSREYGDWRALLHHFYEPFPAVEHFAPITLL